MSLCNYPTVTLQWTLFSNKIYHGKLELSYKQKYWNLLFVAQKNYRELNKGLQDSDPFIWLSFDREKGKLL